MKTFIFFIGLFILPLMTKAQTVDLNNLAQGELVKSFIVNNEEGKLFGYMHIFKVDQIDKETVEYQYVFLDKNLNVSLRTSLIDKKHKRSFRIFTGCDYMGDYFILHCAHYLNPSYGKKLLSNGEAGPILLVNTVQVIDYKEQKVSKECYVSDSEMLEIPEDYNVLKKDLNSFFPVDRNKVFSLGTDEFFGYGAFTTAHKLLVFDENNELLWNYQFADSKDNLKSSIKLLAVNKKFMFTFKQDIRNAKEWNNQFIAFNLESGDKLFEFPIESNETEYRHTIESTRIYGDLIYIQGFFALPRRNTSYKLGDEEGLYQLVLDKKGNEVKRIYQKWEDLKTDFAIHKGSVLDSKYYLLCTGSYTFVDGSSAFIFSPFKQKTVAKAPYLYSYEDLIWMSFDENFTLQSCKLEEREKISGTRTDPNFMYSQYIEDDSGLAFFIRKMDKKKTIGESGKRLKIKEWTIKIGTLINGELKQDELTKETKFKKGGFLSILPAKEGYIILWDESEDESEIRLERLNL